MSSGQRKVMLRLKPRLYEALKEYAYRKRTSMNRLLIDLIEKELGDAVPDEEPAQDPPPFKGPLSQRFEQVR